MYEVFGSRPACAVREITKIHEEVIPFDLKDGFAGEKRGEFVLLVGGAEEKENPLNALSVREHLQKYLSEGLNKKEAVKAVSRDRGVPKNEVYQAAIDL